MGVLMLGFRSWREGKKVEEIVRMVNSRIPMTIGMEDSSLTSGGDFIKHLVSQNVHKVVESGGGVLAFRQVVLLKIIGIKYLPSDVAGYSYSVGGLGYGGYSDPRAKAEELLTTQKWNASGIAWVDYRNIGPDLTARELQYELSKRDDPLSKRMSLLISDLRAISDCGLWTYFHYCKKADRLTTIDKVLMISTFKFLKESATVFREGESPEWAKVAVHTVSEDKRVSREEVVAAPKITPIFDGYVLMRYLPNNFVLNLIDGVKPSPATQDVWSEVSKALPTIIPGWVSVAGIHTVTQKFEKAVLKIVDEVASFISLSRKASDVVNASKILSEVGGLKTLARIVLEGLDREAAPTEERIIDLLRNDLVGRLKDLSSFDTDFNSLVKLLKAISEVSGAKLADPTFWEQLRSINVEVLEKGFSKVAGDERIGKLLRDLLSVIPAYSEVVMWDTVGKFLSRKPADFVPYTILRIGEEFEVGTPMDMLYRSVVPGERGAALARLYREFGVVAPVSYVVDGRYGDELKSLVLEPTKHFNTLIPLTAFYSFGIPVTKLYRRHGKYEVPLPFTKYLIHEGSDPSIELRTFRSEGGRVVEDVAVVGATAELVKLVDDVVINYLDQLRKWGVFDLNDPHVFQGLLYLFSSRVLAEVERMEDVTPPFIANYLDMVRASARLKVRLSGDIVKLGELNAKARKMPEICFYPVEDVSKLREEGKVSDKEVREREKWIKWVEAKYFNYVSELDSYRRVVNTFRANMLSWVQYLHPGYLKRATEASVAVYNTLLDLESWEGSEERIKNALSWLTQKKERNELSDVLSTCFTELSEWYGSFEGRVTKMVEAFPLDVNEELSSTISLFNSAPRLAKLLILLEEAERLERIMKILAIVEEEMRKERERLKQQQRTITSAPPQTQQQVTPPAAPPTAQATPTQEAKAEAGKEEGGKEAGMTTSKEEKKEDTSHGKY